MKQRPSKDATAPPDSRPAGRRQAPPGTLAEWRTRYRSARDDRDEHPEDPRTWRRLAAAQDGLAALLLPTVPSR